MDTRSKILDRAGAVELARKHPRLRVVTGYFDVLLAEHVRELRKLAEGVVLVAAIAEPPQPILAARARAEMAAALEMVDYVIAEDVLPFVADADVVDWRAADGRRCQELIDHVRKRHE